MRGCLGLYLNWHVSPLKSAIRYRARAAITNRNPSCRFSSSPGFLFSVFSFHQLTAACQSHEANFPRIRCDFVFVSVSAWVWVSVWVWDWDWAWVYFLFSSPKQWREVVPTQTVNKCLTTMALHSRSEIKAMASLFALR